MSYEIGPDQLPAAVMAELNRYNEKVIAAVKKAARDEASTCAKDIRANAPRRSGDYADDWVSTRTLNGAFFSTFTVHNRAHYQLTHLLENGHRIVPQGGFVEPVVHIKPYADRAIERFINKAREAAAP